MQQKLERLSVWATRKNAACGGPSGSVCVAGFAQELPLNPQCERTCDKAAPVAAVMLHLRSRYVSKAAILTVPMQSALAENRSPA